MLHYQIAGHTVAIETPDASATAALLPNFDLFRVHDAANGVLFRLSGDLPLAVPSCPRYDSFEWNGIQYEVYNTPGGWTITMQLNNCKQVLYATHDWQHIYTDLSLVTKNEALFLNNFLVMAFGMASAPVKTVKMHASVIEADGKALLFLGKSGTGKSTHSRLCQEFVPDCALLNDDEPVVRLCSNGMVRVFGTPWSGKTPCYKNRSAEVAAFVHLYQHHENKLTQQKGLAAISSLLQSASVMRANSHNKELITYTLSDILKRTPVYRLDCRPDREAVSLTEQLLERSAL